MANEDTQLSELVVWKPELFPHDPEAQAGKCRFAPTCAGVDLPNGKRTRANHPGCPGAPAEFAERTGMTDVHDAGFKRYIALCRDAADRRFGSVALDRAEAEAAQNV